MEKSLCKSIKTLYSNLDAWQVMIITIFFNFWGTKVLFMGQLIHLFWTSGDVFPEFQSQAGSLACFLTCVILRFTSGVTIAECLACKKVETYESVACYSV